MAHAQKTLLLAGCGYVGSHLAEHSQTLLGPDWTVFGLRRQAARLPGNIHAIQANLTAANLSGQLPAVGFDAVVYCAAASSRSEADYRRAYVQGLDNLLAALDGRRVISRRLLVLGSTAVYGVDDGRRVDETCPTSASDFRGQILLEAEALSHAAGGTVLRLGGIYGPGRSRRLRQALQHPPAARAEIHYTNRIHRDDCAGALAHLLGLAELDACYLGVDDLPAADHQLDAFFAELLQRQAPPPPPPGAPERGKRCDNARLRKSGYRLRWPTFRHGYRALVDEAMLEPPHT